jgi:hypothetical protein
MPIISTDAGGRKCSREPVSRTESVDCRKCSLKSLFFGKAVPIFPDHPHFLPTETCVLYRHSEEQVFVVLVVGSKGVLVEQHQFRVIRAGFREVGKILSNRSDQAGLSLHPFVVSHGCYENS